MNENEISMLDELLDQESGLTAWECDFIDDLDGRREKPLTDKQSAALRRAWERVIEGCDNR